MNIHTFLRIWIIFITMVLILALSQAVTARSLAGTTAATLYVKAVPTGLEDCSNLEYY